MRTENKNNAFQMMFSVKILVNWENVYYTFRRVEVVHIRSFHCEITNETRTRSNLK